MMTSMIVVNARRTRLLYAAVQKERKSPICNALNAGVSCESLFYVFVSKPTNYNQESIDDQECYCPSCKSIC